MSISFVSEGVRRPKLSYIRVSNWLKQIIGKFEGVSGNLTYIFCSDEYLRDINYKYLGHDYYTDIITFNYNEGKLISGDMFISIERVNENSVLFEVSPEEELLRVIIHGLLHLLGLKDDNDKEKENMRKIENECIFIFKNDRNE
jgi:probable rRNA maturation factor